MKAPQSTASAGADPDAPEQRLAELEGELDSMSASAAALMEQNAMFGEFLGGLSAGGDDAAIVRLALEKLMVAAHVERAAYVRVHGDQSRGETVASMVLDARTGWPRGEAPSDASAAFEIHGGAIGRALAGNGGAVILPAAESAAEAAPGAPELSAIREVLAAPARFGAAGEERALGVVLIMDRAVSDVRRGEGLGNEEATLAENVALMLATALGSRHAAASDRELKLAREIQQQILPEPRAVIPGFDVAGRCETTGAVGGDYFDFLRMADGRTLAVIADVSGHNLASGMVMVGARSALRLLASRETAPAAVLTGLSEATFGDLQRLEKFVTAAGAAVEPGGGTVELVNAGHNPTMVFRAATARVDTIAGDDPILGFLAGHRYGSRGVTLAHGDVLLLYTDGFTEAQDADGELFGEDRLAAVLAAHAPRTATEILDALYRAVERFAGHGRREDDVTAVVVKRTGGGERDG